MFDDYRNWLAGELALLGNASHHAYAFGQANMAKRALERFDEVVRGDAVGPRMTLALSVEDARAALAGIESLDAGKLATLHRLLGEALDAADHGRAATPAAFVEPDSTANDA